MAQAQLQAGEARKALRSARAGRASADRSAQPFWDAELHRTMGLAHRAIDPQGIAASAHFDRAIEVARGQQAQMLELRASIDLGHLLMATGRDEAAADLLAKVIERASDGGEFTELATARALLAVAKNDPNRGRSCCRLPRPPLGASRSGFL